MKMQNRSSLFQVAELAEMARHLMYALHAGQDLKSSLKKSLGRPRPDHLRFFDEIDMRGLGCVLKERFSASTHFRERIFFLILLQESRSQDLVFRLLEHFIQLDGRLNRVERKKKSLLFLPKFQCGVSLAVICFMVIGLPYFAPLPMPTFFSLGRGDLFMTAIALIVAGLWMMVLMTRRVARLSEPHLQNTFFLMHFRILIDSGKDLLSSWNEAIADSLFSVELKLAMSRPKGSSEELKSFLETMGGKGPQTLRPLFVGLTSALSTAHDLSDFLKSFTESYVEEWFEIWEFQVQKASGLLMLPLLLIVFPASLFLLLGPQLMEIQ